MSEIRRAAPTETSLQRHERQVCQCKHVLYLPKSRDPYSRSEKNKAALRQPQINEHDFFWRIHLGPHKPVQLWPHSSSQVLMLSEEETIIWGGGSNSLLLPLGMAARVSPQPGKGGSFQHAWLAGHLQFSLSFDCFHYLKQLWRMHFPYLRVIVIAAATSEPEVLDYLLLQRLSTQILANNHKERTWDFYIPSLSMRQSMPSVLRGHIHGSLSIPHEPLTSCWWVGAPCVRKAMARVKPIVILRVRGWIVQYLRDQATASNPCNLSCTIRKNY